jgi:hypothetical protein
VSVRIFKNGKGRNRFYQVLVFSVPSGDRAVYGGKMGESHVSYPFKNHQFSYQQCSLQFKHFKCLSAHKNLMFAEFVLNAIPRYCPFYISDNSFPV